MQLQRNIPNQKEAIGLSSYLVLTVGCKMPSTQTHTGQKLDPINGYSLKVVSFWEKPEDIKVLTLCFSSLEHIQYLL